MLECSGLIILYYLLQWTWGIVQNIVGLAFFLVNIRKKHYRFNGAVVTEWNYPRGSLGMGMFIFVSVSKKSPDAIRKVALHEYGHTLQSIILGPLYLIVIGLPSLLWCSLPCFANYRRKHNISYYRFYTEHWANRLAKIDL